MCLCVCMLRRLGKRVLDSISPEERLMRGVPKDISKVIIHHPSQVRVSIRVCCTSSSSSVLSATGAALVWTLHDT